jgi:hypothetical protein
VGNEEKTPENVEARLVVPASTSTCVGPSAASAGLEPDEG